jgi:hypothetical protein
MPRRWLRVVIVALRCLQVSAKSASAGSQANGEAVV